MNWWYRPLFRVGFTIGGFVTFIILALIWLGAAVIIGMGIWRRFGMRIKYHSMIKLTAVFGILIGLIIGYVAGCIIGWFA